MPKVSSWAAIEVYHLLYHGDASVAAKEKQIRRAYSDEDCWHLSNVPTTALQQANDTLLYPCECLVLLLPLMNGCLFFLFFWLRKSSPLIARFSMAANSAKTKALNSTIHMREKRACRLMCEQQRGKERNRQSVSYSIIRR